MPADTISEKGTRQIWTVSFPEWVNALEALFRGGATSQNPAIALLDFFTGPPEKAVYLPGARAVQFDVRTTSHHSQSFASLGASAAGADGAVDAAVGTVSAHGCCKASCGRRRTAFISSSSPMRQCCTFSPSKP